MARTIVQIYEVQTPHEALEMIGLGVDHIGSVITSLHGRYDSAVRETVAVARRAGAVSSLIPLFGDPDAVLETLEHHRPHIVHFCDRLDPPDGGSVEAALDLQATVKRGFPDIRIMRSIPIPRQAGAEEGSVMLLAARLEPVSDYFLTDTVIGSCDGDQPVSGFVGITGQTCDWSLAARLVAASRIPVILAGGIAPENVAEGIRQVRPFGVDSCTATNSVDGSGRSIRFKKDPLRVRMLVSEVRRADGKP
jgi:phosphoribosylanthranilate isomerase